MSVYKNFIVSFRNDTDAIESILSSNIKNDIMDIMIKLNSCSDFESAKNNKICYIQEYLHKDTRVVDYMIMLYGNDLVMQQYQERFGNIVYSSYLTLDFATLILDNIIIICEYCNFPDHNKSEIIPKIEDEDTDGAESLYNRESSSDILEELLAEAANNTED